MSSPQPIHKSEIYIASPLELDHRCILEEVENDSQPSQISLPPVVSVEPPHPLVESHIQPTSFQDNIRD